MTDKHTAALEDAINEAVLNAKDALTHPLGGMASLEAYHLQTLVNALTHPQPQSAGCDGLVKAVSWSVEYLKSCGYENIDHHEPEYQMLRDLQAALKTFKSPPVADKWQDISWKITPDVQPKVKKGFMRVHSFNMEYYIDIPNPEPPVAGGEK